MQRRTENKRENVIIYIFMHHQTALFIVRTVIFKLYISRQANNNNWSWSKTDQTLSLIYFVFDLAAR